MQLKPITLSHKVFLTLVLMVVVVLLVQNFSKYLQPVINTNNVLEEQDRYREKFQPFFNLPLTDQFAPPDSNVAASFLVKVTKGKFKVQFFV
jgi:hypothetical protein